MTNQFFCAIFNSLMVSLSRYVFSKVHICYENGHISFVTWTIKSLKHTEIALAAHLYG